MLRRSRSTRFPHLDVPRRAVQPHYDCCQAVHVGMTRQEVIKLLGRPRCDQFHFPTETYSTYGYLQLPMLPYPRAYSFVLGFDERDRIQEPRQPVSTLSGAAKRDDTKARTPALVVVPAAGVCSRPHSNREDAMFSTK